VSYRHRRTKRHLEVLWYGQKEAKLREGSARSLIGIGKAHSDSHFARLDVVKSERSVHVVAGVSEVCVVQTGGGLRQGFRLPL